MPLLGFVWSAALNAAADLRVAARAKREVKAEVKIEQAKRSRGRLGPPLVPLHHVLAKQRHVDRQVRRADDLRIHAMHLQHDRQFAKTADDLLHVRERPAHERRRGAQWKVWLPRAMLRVAFDLTKGLREVARIEGAGHSHVRTCRAAVAQTFTMTQQRKIENVLDIAAGMELTWVVWTLMWDEAKFLVRLPAEGVSLQSVLTQHAIMHWEDAALTTFSQEIVLSPTVIDRCTADNLYAAVSAKSPVPLTTLAHCSLFPCLQLASDAASSNYLFVKYVSNLLGDVPILWTRCLNHQASLALCSVTSHLGMLGPMFCSVKVLNSGFHLRRIRSACKEIPRKRFRRDTVNAPNPAHARRARRLLNWCYCGSLACRPGKDGKPPAKRVREAEELLVMFSGDISDLYLIVHHCRPGCCSSDDEAIAKALNALFRPLLRRLPVPAANRWLQLAPVLATFVVLGHFHKLLAQAELLLVGQQLESFDGDLFESAADIARAEEPEDKAAREVGAPESANSFRIQNRKRQKKAREWLANAQEQQKLLIWACVARPTLTLHYELLKHGSIKAMTTDERPSMWTAVRMKDSVAVRVLCQLSLCFDTSSTKCDETWGIVIDLHGGFDDWGHQLSKLATWSAHRVAGQLWRRFIVRLRTWPWRLAGVVDVKLSWDARMQIAQDFMDCAECCLDEFWSQTLRKFLKEPADLFLEPIQRFLLAVFMHAVASTSHCENAFAHFRAFLNSCARAPNASTAAAHHVLQESSRIHGEWQEDLLKDTAEHARPGIDLLRHSNRSKRKRPLCAPKSRRRRLKAKLNIRSVFIRAELPNCRVQYPRLSYETKADYRNRLLQLVSRHWGRLSRAEKRQWRKDRDSARAEARQCKDPIEEYVKAAEATPDVAPFSLPWGIADVDFPLAESLLKEASDHRGRQSFASSQGSAWNKSLDVVVEGSGEVPMNLKVSTPCGEICSRCLGCMEASLGQVISNLVAIVRLVSLGEYAGAEEVLFRFTPVNNDALGFEPVLVLFVSCLQKPAFSGEYIIMRNAHEREDGLGWLTECTLEESYGCQMFAFRTETDVAIAIAEMLMCMDEDVDLDGVAIEQHLVVERAEFHNPLPGVYAITAFEHLVFEELYSCQRCRDLASSADKALRKSQQPLPKAGCRKPRSASQRRRGQRRRARRDMQVTSRVADVVDFSDEDPVDSAASSGVEEWIERASTDDAEQRASHVQRAFAKAKPRARPPPAQRAPPPPPPAPPPPHPSPRPEQRLGKQFNGRSRKETITINHTEYTRLKVNGVYTGISLQCFVCPHAKNLYYVGTDVSLDEAAERLLLWAFDCPGGAAGHMVRGGQLCRGYAPGGSRNP